MKHNCILHLILLFLLFVFFAGCGNDAPIYQSLNMAGNNRVELERVLNHYKKDKSGSLKYEATRYLIRHMPYHYSYSGDYEHYCNVVDSILLLKYDPLTALWAEGDDFWAGYDFKKPVTINRISYIRRGDGNDILPGAEYELFYWQGYDWESLGRQTANDVYLVYKNVPTSALFYIKCHSYGKDNRIFEYKDGHILWR